MKIQKTVTVQTANVLLEERTKAEEFALQQGFDSLQALLRFVIRKMARNELIFDVQGRQASQQAETDIGEGLKDLSAGKVSRYRGKIEELINS